MPLASLAGRIAGFGKLSFGNSFEVTMIELDALPVFPDKSVAIKSEDY